MNYTLNQLSIFLKIVKTKSITRAAEELNLTQPAVSIQLKNFQDQFDIPLTEIIGRKLFVTEFGHEIALAAENILNQVYAINYKTQAYKGVIAGSLKISVVSTGKYVIPYFMTDFLSKHKTIDLTIDVTNKKKVIQSLENNETDFALVSILPEKLPVDKIDLLQNKLFLVGKENVKNLSLKNLNQLFNEIPLIYREQGSGTRQTMEKYLYKNNLSVHKKMELTSNEAVKQALLAGLGYSIMPLIGIRNELLHKELKILSVKGLPIKTTWSLIWLKGKSLSPVASAFLDYLKKDKSKIVAEKFDWYEKY